LILAFLLVLGLALRLWGLAWGPMQAGYQHPGEWIWVIIDRLSWSEPVFHGIWTQSFFSLAALLQGIVSAVGGWVCLILGQVRSLEEVEISALLMGRLTVALLGTAQVVLVYLGGRRFFDSVATGLLGAALVAVMPILVAHGHFLTLDIPLSFAVLVCLCLAWSLMDRPRFSMMVWIGLALGLTVTTRVSGILVAPAIVLAYILGVRRARPDWRFWLVIWPAGICLGLILGLILGYPGFVVKAYHTQDVLGASIQLGPPAGQAWSDFWAGRWREIQAVVGRGIGIEIVILWLGGTGLMLWKRQWTRLPLVVFPPLYFGASLFLLSGHVAGLAAVWLPLAAMVAVWPLVGICRRFSGRWRPVMAVALVGVILCAWPLWRSMGMAFLFWQESTISAAKFWLQANLPPKAEVLSNLAPPLREYLSTKPLEPKANPKVLGKPDVFLLTALQARKGLGGKTGPAGSAKPAGSDPKMVRGLQLLKRLDLKSGLSGGWLSGAGDLPPWLNPSIEVFSALPQQEIVQPLSLFRPPVGMDKPYAVIYGDDTSYERCQGVIHLEKGKQVQRVLRSSQALKRLGLHMINLGDDLGVVEISQGLWPSRVLNIYPGQEIYWFLPARSWPPVAKGYYPLSFRVWRGHRLRARIDWEPLLMARRSMELGLFSKASEVLSDLIKAGKGSFEAHAMLAEARVRMGQVEQASRALATLDAAGGRRATLYQALAMDLESGASWEKQFAQFTGYHPSLLRQTSSFTYLMQRPLYPPGGDALTLCGPGYRGVLGRPDSKAKAQLKLWLEGSFPRGGLEAVLYFKAPKNINLRAQFARLEVWSQGLGTEKRLAARTVNGKELMAQAGMVRIPFNNQTPGAPLQVRAEFLSPAPMELERVDVGVDIKSHMRHVLRWYLDAWGHVSLGSGRFNPAVAAYEALLSMDPDFREAYLPLAQALLDTGRIQRAYDRTRRAEEIFKSQPAKLVKVRDLYQLMQKPQDVERVDKLLGHLRPSLKREVRFAGGLTLLGYDLPKAWVKAGDKLDVSYYWHCWSPPPLNYFIFVHLRRGREVVNFDHRLDHGRISMTALDVGQVVREDYNLKIPPDLAPGRYSLVVGLWDPDYTRKGVPIVEGESKGREEILLATIEVR
jgi:4-amino-4-deoxy-L-arabinose transferase-like glycosyltransferase/tetratricopeptide (TPR) repeat protein